MLEYLHLKNVGPAAEMHLEPARRLNVITGDNGLGKSFLLDVAWWALTRRWPAEVNPDIGSGRMARPDTPGEASIEFSFQTKSRKDRYRSTFDRRAQAWTGRPGRPGNPGMVIYAQVDGGFSVWDPARNYWRTKANTDVQERAPAYVFSARQVWDGLHAGETALCNGLIADWALWQKERGETFELLVSALEVMSPSPSEQLYPGELGKLSLDDARWVPTLRTPYGRDVLLPLASAGVRRIIALTYLLVWAWQEHQRAAKDLDEEPTDQVTFLVDEIESHLHPRWQRTIIASLLEVTRRLAADASVQLLCATHSPLVMASVEPFFDEAQDAWFDLDLVPGSKQEPAKVALQRRRFTSRGNASSWLTSDAFDLESGGLSVQAEEAVKRALALLRKPKRPSKAQARAVDQALKDARLPATDPFWVRWSAFYDGLAGSR
jgi:AAA domain, putative AbiEii toxin, Type IV TA system